MGRMSKGFGVKVGLHQGSVLSLLLFHRCVGGLVFNFCWMPAYETIVCGIADDLALMAESEQSLTEKIQKLNFDWY